MQPLILLLALILFCQLAGCSGGSSNPDGIAAINADFSVSPEAPVIRQPVTFVAQSANASSFSWSSDSLAGFSGSGGSYEYVFDQPGSYQITLTATGRSGTLDVHKTVEVTAPDVSAGFTFSPAVPVAGQTVVFANTSSNASRYRWSSAPSGLESDLISPTHAFENEGQYQITLTAADEFGNESSVSQALTVVSANSTSEPLAFTLSNEGQSYGKALSVDQDDNFYITALFEGQIDGKPNTSVGLIDNYIAKHTRDGRLEWEVFFGARNGLTVGHGIEMDAAQNVYVTGYFGNEANDEGLNLSFGNDIAISSQSGFDAFVAKYSSDGEILWAFGLGNSEGNTEERAWDLAVENNGDFYISGAFSGSVDFNPRGQSPHPRFAAGIGHFLAKYDADGQNLWVRSLDANVIDVFSEGYSTVDADNAGTVWLSGVYRGDLSIDGSVLTSQGDTDIFVAAMDSQNGNLKWVKSFGGPQTDIVSPGAMRVNDLGEPHLTGRFSGASQFGDVTLESESAGNTFLLALDKQGNTKWALAHRSHDGLDGGHRVAFDQSDNTFVTGWYRGNATFDSDGSVELNSFGTNNASDIFLAKYGPEGVLLWAQSFGSVVAGSENLSIAAGLAVDSIGQPIITGKFYGQEAFFGRSRDGEVRLSSQGIDDTFVVKYTPEGSVYQH